MSVICGLPIPRENENFTLRSETNKDWYHVFCNKNYPVDAYSFSKGWGQTRFAPITHEDSTSVHTYYLASTTECAYMESALHDVPLSPPGFFDTNDLINYHLVKLRLLTELSTVSFHTKYLPKLNLNRMQLIDSLPGCYSETRAWAQAAYLQCQSAKALAYGSRLDDSGRCLMLFRQRMAHCKLEPTFKVLSVESLASEPNRSEILNLMHSLEISTI